MPRPHRIQFPGALYHVTARGNNGSRMFRSQRDGEAFLDLLAVIVRRHHVLVHAYCLMGNHYHLLLGTPLGNVSRALQYLNGVYCQAFNRRHKRSGHILGARFHSSLIVEEAHLFETARYIVCNPCRAGLCAHPEQWPWSSYRATAGHVAPPRFLTTRWLLGQLASDQSRAWQRYRDLVAARLDAPLDLRTTAIAATRERARPPRAEAA